MGWGWWMGPRSSTHVNDFLPKLVNFINNNDGKLPFYISTYRKKNSQLGSSPRQNSSKCYPWHCRVAGSDCYLITPKGSHEILKFFGTWKQGHRSRGLRSNVYFLRNFVLKTPPKRLGRFSSNFVGRYLKVNPCVSQT